MASILQLEYAVELARQGNFGRAARKCFITQPTLSMQIQKLEEEYEVMMFDRSRKPIVPTVQGAQLIEQFRRVLSEWKRIDQLVANQKGRLSGSYHLGIIPTIAPSLLPKFIPKFIAKHGEVDLRVTEITTDQIVHSLIDGSIDAGILATPLHNPAIHETHLFYEPLHIYHSKGLEHNWANSKLVTLSDLPMEKLLVLTEGNCLRTQTIDLCALKEMSHDRLQFEIEAASLLTLMNIIQGGEFFTILPHLASLALPKQVRETQIKKLKDQNPVREIGLVTHRSQIKAGINQAVHDTIRSLGFVKDVDPSRIRVLAPQ